MGRGRDGRRGRTLCSGLKHGGGSIVARGREDKNERSEEQHNDAEDQADAKNVRGLAIHEVCNLTKILELASGSDLTV